MGFSRKEAKMEGHSVYSLNSCTNRSGTGSMRTKNRKNSVGWPFRSSVHAEAMISDMTAPSSWKIFDFQNGLRLFKEAKHPDLHEGHRDDPPAIMAVGKVDGTPKAVFLALMSLGPSRSEWDFCVCHGSVVECLDGHTDIIHEKLYSDWLPWSDSMPAPNITLRFMFRIDHRRSCRGMKRRDLLLRRYWRREDGGAYMILYHSVVHKKCPPQSGNVRAHLKSGGYVITPVNQGQQSIVKHLLSIDWKFWKFYLWPSAARSLTISMLKRVAGVRLLTNRSRSSGSGKGIYTCLKPKKTDNNIDTKSAEKIEEDDLIENEMEKPASAHVTLMGLNEEPDEFFDVPEASEFADDDHSDSEWNTEPSSKLCVPNSNHPKLTPEAGFVRKLHDLATQKKGYMDLQEVAKEDTLLYCYGNSLQKDPTCTLPCSWSAGGSSWFLIRGADWLISDKREDDLSSRLGSIVQKHASQGGSEFFFVINLQVPGTPRYTLAMYYMMKSPLADHPLLFKFVNGDDAFRNSRFKVIPFISKGSWMAKQSVGKRASLLGQSLETHYFRGKNYMEVHCFIVFTGSYAFTPCKNRCRHVLYHSVSDESIGHGYVCSVLFLRFRLTLILDPQQWHGAHVIFFWGLVLEMAFIIQGNTEEELPEVLIGTCRLNHLDPSKALS
ncbi:hypothetical protein V6N13_075189 [Hibiscus sabdariffa]|uniref:START domain-containing protein n=1 Tax=Hibiscus sabdariffa TaxID=183260 RepID=A0ABR2UAR4_9ROSI